ncbi:methylated-DNA--protein-cysteine methyltransferase [Bacteroidia bacterium]|nr:methylated-DNA--protein-cysteine methyltransferase [Bacteroidia bacterium]
MTAFYTYHTPIGYITITANEKAVVKIAFGKKEGGEQEGSEQKETSQLKIASTQIEEYFAGKRRVFDFPIQPKGTPFQLQVWAALRQIPYGQTRSYKQIAEAIGHPKACRAVGMANNKNPLPIVVPCHRVIGADGKLVGYAGGLEVKKKMLELEKSTTFVC